MSNKVSDVFIETRLLCCKALSKSIGEGAEQAVEIARLAGGTFLRMKKTAQQPTWQIHPEPTIEMDAEGNFVLWLEYAHPLLARALFEHERLKSFNPVGQFGFIQSSRTVSIGQAGDANDRKCLDELANGQLSLSRMLYSAFGPSYGFVDAMGDNEPTYQSVRKPEIKAILWANFFGPDYVQKWGRDLFLQAPVWKSEELDDGGILCVVTQSYHDWWTSAPTESVEYFRRRFPSINAYRAVIVDW